MDDLTRARRNAEQIDPGEEPIPPNPQYSLASELDADEWDAEFRRVAREAENVDAYAKSQVRDFALEASRAAEVAGNIAIRDAFKRIAVNYAP